jgi:hypothetical protein
MLRQLLLCYCLFMCIHIFPLWLDCLEQSLHVQVPVMCEVWLCAILVYLDSVVHHFLDVLLDTIIKSYFNFYLFSYSLAILIQ